MGDNSYCCGGISNDSKSILIQFQVNFLLFLHISVMLKSKMPPIMMISMMAIVNVVILTTMTM